MARLASRLARSERGRDVIDAIDADAAAAVGLDLVTVSFVREGSLVGDEVRWPVAEEHAERSGTTPLSAHEPRAEAARTLRTVVVPDLLAYQADHADLRAEVEA